MRKTVFPGALSITHIRNPITPAEERLRSNLVILMFLSYAVSISIF
jgi:hypothetical protein